MSDMRIMSVGMTGADVGRWQKFLSGQGLYRGEQDGKFHDETRQATIDFQRLHEILPADGKTNNKTLGMAMLLGLVLIDENEDPKKLGTAQDCG